MAGQFRLLKMLPTSTSTRIAWVSLELPASREWGLKNHSWTSPGASRQFQSRRLKAFLNAHKSANRLIQRRLIVCKLMRLILFLICLRLYGLSAVAKVLFIADEFPAMEVVAARLNSDE